jgi:putative hydrolase of HD superfamily
MVDFLLKALELKDEARSGWELRGVRGPESVADHSWGTALLCWLYAPSGGRAEQAPADTEGPDAAEKGIDRERAVLMALVHDIAEAEMGDVATRVHASERRMSAAEKRGRERAAFDTVRDLLDQSPEGGGAPRAQELEALWAEYEAGETETARFVRDMNLCDMCLQALFYERGKRYDPAEASPAFLHFERLDEFFETSRGRLSTAAGWKLFRELEQRYRSVVDRDAPARDDEGRGNGDQ